MTSLNKGQRPSEVTEILNYDLDGEQENTLEELKQLKKEYVDCDKEKEEIKSELSYYKEGYLPKTIAGLFVIYNHTSHLKKTKHKTSSDCV